MNRISVLFAVSLILVPRTAPAPIYGGFEDLDKLMERAEFVVVAEIIKRPPPQEMDMGAGGTFEIEVLKAIKGDVKLGKRSSAYLRDVPFTFGPHSMASLTQCFVPGGRYLLFLNKPGTHIHDQNGKPLPVDFENENCEGDAVWISSCSEPPTGYFDLESLKGKSARESIIAILNHTATQEQGFANAVKMMIESKADIRLTQTITQAIWVAGDVEEAAKFYLSIFKNSAKDPNMDHYAEVGPDSKSTLAGVRLWIDGQDIVLLNGGPKFQPTKAIALTLNCDLQEQIDYYWDKLSAGGEKSRAGWLKDRFGVWWHVVPTDLSLLLGGKYGNAERVKEAMLKMDKIDSAALRRAAYMY